MRQWALALHGGAGKLARGDLTAAQDAAYRASLRVCAEAGRVILAGGGTALDAAQAAVCALEDDPLFNAGRGAVFTAEGKNELDASIMDGASLRAGAVAGISRTRSPITLARSVMEKSPHVLLIGAQADAFGQSQGLEQVAPGHFFTEPRWRSLEKFLGKHGLPLPARPAGAAETAAPLAYDEGVRGTVGAVARDQAGNVAAATSTGGMTGKRWGRVGDSPIIGAGTYAANASAAVSATGDGEYFIRLGVAREICALVEHKGLDLQTAVDAVIQGELKKIGGTGGVIAINCEGDIACSFNTDGMYRAVVADTLPLRVAIYRDDI